MTHDLTLLNVQEVFFHLCFQIDSLSFTFPYTTAILISHKSLSCINIFTIHILSQRSVLRQKLSVFSCLFCNLTSSFAQFPSFVFYLTLDILLAQLGLKTAIFPGNLPVLQRSRQYYRSCVKQGTSSSHTFVHNFCFCYKILNNSVSLVSPGGFLQLHLSSQSKLTAISIGGPNNRIQHNNDWDFIGLPCQQRLKM